MDKIQLQILGLSYSQTQDNAYVLILIEEQGDRRMPIIIGAAEAQAIAIELEKMKPPRPLTHDLFKTLADNLSITLDEVIIYKLQEGIFYAKIILRKDDFVFEIDSRTSDAVAIGIRFNCPIYTTSEVLTRAGIVLEKEQEKIQTEVEAQTEEADNPEIAFATDSELEDMLAQAIESEDYEFASKIRDEIKKRTIL